MDNFKINAVKDEKCYKHFNIWPSSSVLYGVDPKDIVTLEMGVAEDQGRPEVNGKYKDADYWGYYDNDNKGISLIYPQYFLLNMCFPSGIDAVEERGQGKAYRLKVFGVT